MTGSSRAVGAALAIVVTALVSGCGGGGFSSSPSSSPDKTVHSYVALGDGFAAAPYVGGAPADDTCLRSDEDYPSLVAQKLGVQDFHDVSCVGATTDDIQGTQKAEKGKASVPAQINALDEGTDLVTIGIGIEDDGLLQNLFRVCVSAPCKAGTVSAHDISAGLDAFGAKLAAVVRAVQAKAPSAYIVVVGYPKITPDSGGCDQLPTFADKLSLDAANYGFAYLDRQLQSAARVTGSGYVDTQSLSAGHELCTADPWVNGKKDEPGKAVAYHPVAAEQRAVADQIIDLVRTR